MLIVLEIYLVIGFFIYLSEKKLINEDEDEIEIYNELNDIAKIMYFLFTVLFWFPILLLYWFTNFFENFHE
jgi:hypothetical protein